MPRPGQDQGGVGYGGRGAEATAARVAGPLVRPAGPAPTVHRPDLPRRQLRISERRQGPTGGHHDARDDHRPLRRGHRPQRPVLLPPILAHARGRLRPGPGPRADRPGGAATVRTRPANDANRALDVRLACLAHERPGLVPARFQLRNSAFMKIATYNVNGIGARLPVLLQWLACSKPDVACLQELKAPDEKFPVDALREAGYEAVWHGQKAWNGVAILARGEKPEETRRGLSGDPDDTHSRYIEAVVGGITVGCLYLPNGNPAPGPKLDYKLKWFERLSAHAASLIDKGGPVVLAGDYNVIPTERDVYKPERWVGDALFLPETREAYRRLLAQGWTDSLRHLHPDEAIYTFWDYMRGAFSRDAGLRIDHLLLGPGLAPRLKAAGVDRDIRAMEKTSDHAPTWVELEG